MRNRGRVVPLLLSIGTLGVTPLTAQVQPVGAEFRVNSYTTNGQTHPRVTSDAVGNFVVVWQSADGSGTGGIFAQRYDRNGSPLGSDFRVNTYTTDTQALPFVSSDPAGNFVVVWQSNNQDGSGYGIFGQRYDSVGSALGSEFKVNAYTYSTQWNPALATSGTGDFVVAWSSNLRDDSGQAVVGQRIGANGAFLGFDFRVNTYGTTDQRWPAVACDSTGNFVVVWQSGYGQDGSLNGIYGQRFASSGTKLGSEFRLNTYTSNQQTRPSVSVGGSGSFVAVWQSTFQDAPGSNFGIFGQRFASNGAPLGAEFQVNSYTTNDQKYPSVAADASGAFVVAWQSVQVLSNSSVFAQRFGSDGTPLGSEFRVNSYTTDVKRYPSIAADSAGDFVVVWQSQTQDGSSDGIFAQRYCVDLASVTIDVNGSTTVCPTGTSGTATVHDTGGGSSTHQWAYRTMSGGANNDIAGQTGTTYLLNGADFPGIGTYFLVCKTTPTCGSMTTSNEVIVTVDPTDSTAPVVTAPAAATATQTLCQ